MQVDVSFDFAKVYDVTKIDVVTGQEFKLLTDSTDPEAEWFSSNDPVLDITVTGSNAQLKAAKPGKSIILILNASQQVQKKLTITVVDEIKEPAADLGLSAGEPVSK